MFVQKTIKFLFSRRVGLTPKQVFLNNMKDDNHLKQLLKEDQVSAMKSVDKDYLPAPKRGESQMPTVTEKLTEQSTFLLEKQRAEKMENALKICGIDDAQSRAIIKQMQKEDLFRQKKESEEQEKLDDKVKNLQRVKELKKMESELKKNKPLPDDQNAEQIPYFNKMNQEEKLNQLEYWTNRFNSEGKIDPYLLQRSRTSKNIEDYIINSLMEQQKYLQRMGFQYAITIDEILTNQSCTVAWVFWNFVEPQEDKKIEEIYKNKLKKFAIKFSWKMCQELGLKYGPDIRFLISRKKEKLEEIKKEIDENAESIVTQELLNQYEKGEIPSKISKKKFTQIVQNIREKKDQLDNSTSEFDQLRRKRGSDDKPIRKPAQHLDKGKSAADVFWDKL